MSNSNLLATWCDQCHNYLYLGINPPPSHLKHSRGFTSIGNYCQTCHITIYDNMKLPDNHPHLRHTLEDKQAIKQDSLTTQLKAESEGKGIKIVDKGNYVKTSGILPNEDIVLHEKMIEAIANKRRNEGKQ